MDLDYIINSKAELRYARKRGMRNRKPEKEKI